MKQNKNISMSIRFSTDELYKLKKAAELSSYGTFSEFVRRTALIEVTKIIAKQERKVSSLPTELIEHEVEHA